MLWNKQTKRNLAILLMATVVVGLTMTAWAKKPPKPPGGGGGPVGTGTIYYSHGGWVCSMNPDGTGKTPLLAWADYDVHDASTARHPAEGDRWFLQVSGIGGFYPITTFPPEPIWVPGLDDLEAVGFTGDPDPDGAWGTIYYYIEIDGFDGEADNPDTFKWQAESSLFEGGSTPEVTGVPITGGDQELLLVINGSTVVLTIKFGSTTGHTFGDPFGDAWAIDVKKTQRSELFAVREDGQIKVQLTDDPTVQPWRPGDPRRALACWATQDGVADGKVSYLAQRWGKDAQNEDIVVERGIFVAEIDPETLPYGNPTFVPVQPNVLPVSVPMGPYDWSPDGNSIVYTAPGPEIWVANPYSVEAGTKLCDGCDGYGPRWSPVLDDVGSTLIAFVVGSWGDAEIRTISPDGGPATTVVALGKNLAIRGDSIYWSPMGTHLVYTRIHSKACRACQYNDSYDVYRVGADGSNSTNLTNDLKELAFSMGWRD